MIELLYQGRIALFLLIVLALVISLSFHEFGHAATAKLFGDNTAQLAGRLTLNPLAHIDPMGLIMVMLVGFGYAKPVPTDPSKFRSQWADLLISSAGPGMNFLLAFVSINAYILALNAGVDFLAQQGPQFFFVFLAKINLLLMIFNLIPLGALDGHYILPYFLSRNLAYRYRLFNARYGNMALMGFVLLSIVGLPVFNFIWSLGNFLLPVITVVPVHQGF